MSTASTFTQFIVHGASRWDLMLAVFNGQKVEFRTPLIGMSRFSLEVEGIYNEDGKDSVVDFGTENGDSEWFNGLNQCGTEDDWIIVGTARFEPYPDISFEAYLYYSTHTRRGFARFYPREAYWHPWARTPWAAALVGRPPEKYLTADDTVRALHDRTR